MINESVRLSKQNVEETCRTAKRFETFPSLSPLSEDIDIDEYRKTTMNIAEMLRALEHPTLQSYDLFSWNCETFALVCTTRSLHVRSEQVKKLFHLCDEDLRRGRDSQILLLGSAVSSSSGGSCGIM